MGYFLPFYLPITAWKIKILQKFKKRLEISSFYNSAPKIMIICYTVPEIWGMPDVILIFHLGLFFRPYTPLKNLINENFKKMKKKTPGDIIILHKCTQNHDRCTDVIIIFHFGLYFALLTPPPPSSNSPKN